jgi:hypothetical protein
MAKTAYMGKVYDSDWQLAKLFDKRGEGIVAKQEAGKKILNILLEAQVPQFLLDYSIFTCTMIPLEKGGIRNEYINTNHKSIAECIRASWDWKNIQLIDGPDLPTYFKQLTVAPKRLPGLIKLLR